MGGHVDGFVADGLSCQSRVDLTPYFADGLGPGLRPGGLVCDRESCSAHSTTQITNT